MVSITPEKLVDLVVAISTNLHRRHLTESQRASIAARLANMRHGQRADYLADRDANLHLCEQAAPPPARRTFAAAWSIHARRRLSG
jgi:hypothetical protein